MYFFLYLPHRNDPSSSDSSSLAPMIEKIEMNKEEEEEKEYVRFKVT